MPHLHGRAVRVEEVGSGWRSGDAADPARPHRTRFPSDDPALALGAVEWVALLSVVTASVVLFGGVMEHHLALCDLAIVALAAILLARRWARREPLLAVHPTAWPLLALTALGAWQLVPLPASLVAVASPGVVALRADLPGEPAGFLALSAYPYATRLAVLRLAGYALFYVLALEALTTRGRVRTALQWSAALATAVATYGLFSHLAGSGQLLWLPRRHYLDSVSGTYVNRNNFASLMILLIPTLAASYWAAPAGARARGSNDGPARALFYALCGAVTVLALLFSRSRAGLLIGPAVLGAVAFVARRHRLARGRASSGVLMAAGGLAFLYAAYIGLDAVVARFETANAAGSVSHRLALWRDTMPLVRDFPVFGSGLGTYPHLFRVYKTSTVAFALEHAHSDYLELLADGGIAAIAILAWAFVRFGALAAAGVRSAAARSGLIACALAAGIGGMLLHGAVDFGLQIPGNVFALLLCAAVLVRVIEAPHLVGGRRGGAGSPGGRPQEPIPA
jgi:O-antigen ligase